MHTTENTKCIVVKVVGLLWCHLPWPTEELKLHSSQHVRHSAQSKRQQTYNNSIHMHITKTMLCMYGCKQDY